MFAPYFPPDQPQKFANVHKVFGASNVAKILNELNPAQREEAVNSLAYEAEARSRDPVYGCVGLISVLQHKLKLIQLELYNAKKELSSNIGLPLAHPMHQLHGSSLSPMGPFGMPNIGLGLAQPSAQTQLLLREQQQQQQQQMLEVHQLAAVVSAQEQQEMMQDYELQQQQQHLVDFDGGFDGGNRGRIMDGPGFNHIAIGHSPSSPASVPFDNPFQPEEEHHPQHQQRYGEGIEEGKGSFGQSS